VARLQQFGVIFGYQRVVIYVEPHVGPKQGVIPNTPRTALLLNGEPLPWAEWAAQFREKLPEAITSLMDEVSGGASAADHQQAIRERLRQIRDLFRLSRYRPAPHGTFHADFDAEKHGGSPRPADPPTRTSTRNGGGAGGRVGNIYALFQAEHGSPAELVHPDFDAPEVHWIRVADGTRTQGLLEDRAAQYLVEQNLLQINGDFRVFTDMVTRWEKQYAHAPNAHQVITDVVHEWFEQSLIETVIGVQSLRGAREWTAEEVGQALSEQALTAAVMQRYHLDVAIKRSLGSKLGTLSGRTS
jgi:hypothetical protein